jgi:hypothetical protein
MRWTSNSRHHSVLHFGFGVKDIVMLSIQFARFGSRGALELMLAGDSPNIAKSYIWNVEIMFLQIMDMVKQTPTYKNKMKALELEHSQARTNKEKGSKNKIWLVLFEFHMKKKMPPKGRVLTFMMKFSMGNFFSCWVCEVY